MNFVHDFILVAYKKFLTILLEGFLEDLYFKYLFDFIIILVSTFLCLELSFFTGENCISINYIDKIILYQSI